VEYVIYTRRYFVYFGHSKRNCLRHDPFSFEIVMKRLLRRLLDHLALGISVEHREPCFYGHIHQHFLG